MNQMISYLSKSIEIRVLTNNMFHELLYTQLRFSQRTRLLKCMHLLLLYWHQSMSRCVKPAWTEQILSYPLQGSYIIQQSATQNRSFYLAQHFFSYQIKLAKEIQNVEDS